jgi:hypothetical protein
VVVLNDVMGETQLPGYLNKTPFSFFHTRKHKKGFRKRGRKMTNKTCLNFSLLRKSKHALL